MPSVTTIIAQFIRRVAFRAVGSAEAHSARLQSVDRLSRGGEAPIAVGKLCT